jgi:Skp family chaperone for outer membrane proteins
MKRLFSMFALVLLISASQAMAAAPAVKLGAVDLQRAVKECREGVAVRADLQKKIEQFNAELKLLQVDYQRLSSRRRGVNCRTASGKHRRISSSWNPTT